MQAQLSATSSCVPAVSVFQANAAEKWGKGGSQAGKKGSGKGGGKGGGDDDEEQETWGFLDFSRFQGWDVPWSGASVAGGMALWFGSFVAVGFLVVPGLYGAAGGA